VTAVAVAAGRFRRITGARDGVTALVRSLKDHENALATVPPRRRAALSPKPDARPTAAGELAPAKGRWRPRLRRD
jgi:hypothetical protein